MILMSIRCFRNRYLAGMHLSKKYKFLPIDTKYFKELEIEILNLFDDLDNSLRWLAYKK
jgi:hypothetical protein